MSGDSRRLRSAPCDRSAAGAVALEVVGACAESGRLVLRIEQLAFVDREAAAPDACRQAAAEGLEHRDPAVEVGAPPLRQAFPVAAARDPVLGQSGERLVDLSQRDAGGLARLDESDSPEHRAVVAALVAVRPPRADEALLLVEAERGSADAAPPRQFADRQLIVRHLTSTLLEVLRCGRRRPREGPRPPSPPRPSSAPRYSPSCGRPAASSSTSTGTRCACSPTATPCTRSTTAARTWASRSTAERSPTASSRATGTTRASTSVRAARSTSSPTTCASSPSRCAVGTSMSTRDRASTRWCTSASGFGTGWSGASRSSSPKRR